MDSGYKKNSGFWVPMDLGSSCKNHKELKGLIRNCFDFCSASENLEFQRGLEGERAAAKRKRNPQNSFNTPHLRRGGISHPNHSLFSALGPIHILTNMLWTQFYTFFSRFQFLHQLRLIQQYQNLYVSMPVDVDTVATRLSYEINSIG